MNVIKRSLSIILVVSMLSYMSTFVSYANEITDVDTYETLLTEDEFVVIEPAEDNDSEQPGETKITDEELSSLVTEEVVSEQENDNIVVSQETTSPSAENIELDDTSSTNENSDEPSSNDEIIVPEVHESEESEYESDESEEDSDSEKIEDEVLTDESYEEDTSTAFESGENEDDAEAELMIDWLYKNRMLEIAANGTVARKEAKSSSKAMRTYKVGDFVEIVDKKLFSDWYKTDEGYWIYGSNLREHKHSPNTPKTESRYKPKNNKQHVCYTKTLELKCRCNQTLTAYSEKEAQQAHSYNDVGYCSKCKYTYSYSIKWFGKTKRYQTNEALSLRKQPYDKASADGNYGKGVVISIVGETKNAFDNTWYFTADGKWVYSKWVSKHSHSYNSSTGFCSCGEEKPYSTASTKNVERWEVKTDLYLKTRPFSGATNSSYVSKGTVLFINGYTYTSVLGFKDVNWYRTSDGKWIHEDNIKEHKHTNSSYSGGICKNPGCGHEYELKIEPIKNQGSAVQYEPAISSVDIKVAPYSNRQTKQTIGDKNTIILIKAKTKNSHGNTWYQTSEGYWVYSKDVIEHSHKIVAGSCYYSGCNYAYQITPNTFNEKTYVTSSNNIQSYKLPYFDAKTSNVYENKGTKIIINAEFKNNDGEPWYRSVNGEWFSYGSIEIHSHNYKNGICTLCGEDEPIQIFYIPSATYETKKANVPVYKKPYATSSKINTLKSKGTLINIIGYTRDSTGKPLWYITADTFQWISADNLTKSKRMLAENSFVATKDDFVLKVADDQSDKGIPDATVTFGTQNGITNSAGYVVFSNTTKIAELSITAPNYKALKITGYEIPSRKSDVKFLDKEETAQITMAVLLRNKISTDVVYKEVVLNQASNGLSFDLTVCSNVENANEYRLVQNGKIIKTSKTGNFTSLYADDFNKNQTVYAQVVDANGNVKVTQKLLISVVYSRGNVPTSLSLGESLKISFSQKAPIPFSGMSLELKVPNNLPIYVELNENKIKGAINFKPSSDKDKTSKWWDDLKRLNDSTFKDYYNKYVVDDWQNDGVSSSLKLKFGGYVEGAIDSSYAQGKIFVGAEYKNGLEIQLGTVPVVAEFSFKGSLLANGSIRIDELKKVSGNLDITLDVGIGAYVGLGWRFVGSIGIYGNGTWSNKLAVLPKCYFDESYFTADFGVKAKLLGREIFNEKIIQCDKYYLYRHGAVLSEVSELTNDDYYAWLFDVDSYQAMDRTYLDTRSGWYDSGVDLLEDESVVVSQFDFETLQSNTYTDIRPQVATTDNTIMMAYVDDNAERDADNRTMLVYSLYNADSGKWSEPKAVYDNDMADFNFSLVSNGEAIYVVWQKATKHITPEMTVTDISKITDLYVAKFDEAMGSFQNIEQVTTGNDVYEMMPRVSSVNGKTVVAWFENSEGDVFGQEGFNTVHYAVKLDKDYAPGPESDISDDEFLPADTVIESPIEVDDETEIEQEIEKTEWTTYEVDKYLPAITSLAVGYMFEDGYIAFTIDDDHDYSTIDDQRVYLVSILTGELILYTDKAMNVEFVKVHGDNAMTWYNQGYIYYTYGPDYAPQMIYSDAGIPCDEYHIISANNGDMAILYTVKSNDQSDAYVILYDDETFEWGLPIQVTKQDKYIQNFNGAYYDEMIVSVFNKTDVNNKTLFEKNDLCCAVIGERYDLMIENVIFEDLDVEPETEYPLVIDVKNNGTRRINSFNLAVSDQGSVIDAKTITASIKPGETYTIETSITTPPETQPSTLTVELDHDGVADADITNNVSDLRIGRANMFIDIETSAEETYNALYISILNKGYTPSSGSIVLYDENFNTVKTLVDSIDEIGYQETYNCSVVLDSDAFEGEMYKAFFIGVIPSAEQYTNDYNATSIYLKNALLDEDAQIDVTDAELTSSQEDVSLMENHRKTVAGVVRNENECTIENAQIIVMAFDSNGIYLGSRFQSVNLEAGESAEFSVGFDTEVEIDSVKISIINPISLEPLSDFTEISIYDETIEKTSEDEEALYNEIIEVEEEY